MKKDIDESVASQVREGAEKNVRNLLERIEKLPPEMQDEVRKQLRGLGEG